MIEIFSATDPRIAPFTAMRSNKPWLGGNTLGIKGEEELVVAEGKKVVDALLGSALPVLAVLAEERYYDDPFLETLAAAGVTEERRYLAHGSLLKEVVGYRMHQGIMALGLAPSSVPLDALEGPIVALSALANAENVGAIVRNCAAFGVKSLVVDSACVSPFSRRSVKVAMGTAFDVAVHRAAAMPEALRQLSAMGVTVVAAALTPTAVALPEYRFPKSYALVMGSEGHGLDDSILAAADCVVKIPICVDVDSLNVAAATAVMLYHAQIRPEQGGPPHQES